MHKIFQKNFRMLSKVNYIPFFSQINYKWGLFLNSVISYLIEEQNLVIKLVVIKITILLNIFFIRGKF